MENREQIIKALECCVKIEQGGLLSVECDECPYGVGDNDCKNLEQDALSLIKELTEEALSWKEIAEGYQKLFEDCAEDRARLTEENERLRAENETLKIATNEQYSHLCDCLDKIAEMLRQKEADTVREFADRLKTKTYTNNYCQEIVLESDIDQISKEMLEGE